MYNSWAWLKVAEGPKFKRARKTGLQFVPLTQAQGPVHGHQQPSSDVIHAEAGAGRAVPGLLEAAAEGEKEAPDSRKKPRSPPEAPTHSCIYDGKKGTHPVPFVF